LPDSGNPQPPSRGNRRGGERFIRNQDQFNTYPAQARRVVRWWVSLSTAERHESLLLTGSDSNQAAALSVRAFLKLDIEVQVRLERAYNRDYGYTQDMQLPGMGRGNSHV
jgi:hypothetical protein